MHLVLGFLDSTPWFVSLNIFAFFVWGSCRLCVSLCVCLFFKIKIILLIVIWFFLRYMVESGVDLVNLGRWRRKRGRSMAGGQAPPPKQEELQPHPAKDQLPNIAYCITSPPPWRECQDALCWFFFSFATHIWEFLWAFFCFCSLFSSLDLFLSIPFMLTGKVVWKWYHLICYGRFPHPHPPLPPPPPVWYGSLNPLRV